MKYLVRAISPIMLISLGANCALEDTVKLPIEIEMSRVSTSDSLPLYTSDQHQESDSFWDNTPRSQADSDYNDIPKSWESMTEMPQDIRARNRHQYTDDPLPKECNNALVQQEFCK